MTEQVLTAKDLKTSQDVRWCPGCGDYAILAAVQRTIPKLSIPKEKIVFISGIGCSSRFPYYMNTYGFHTIHGRAPAIATGVKLANPDLSVWIISGDGDALSIGGNHFMHMIRRNLDVNYLIFNNEIYGLTKGQVSPTSKQGTVTKTSLFGSKEKPVNPLKLAIASGATFVARTTDRDPKHMAYIIQEATKHKGTSVIEIYQNCVIFNDGVFDSYSNKESKEDRSVFVEEDKPLKFASGSKAIKLDGLEVKVVDSDADGLYIHKSLDNNEMQTYLYGIMTEREELPTPFGIFYKKSDITYDSIVHNRIKQSKENNNKSLQAIFSSGDTWTIK